MKSKLDRVVERVTSFDGVKEFETVYILTYVMDLFIHNEITFTSFKIFLLKSVLDNNTFNSLTSRSIESQHYMCGNQSSFKKAYQELYDKKILWREKDKDGNYLDSKININYNKKRANERGVKFNPKIYFRSFYLHMFLASSVLTERLARFLCVILMNIQSVPTVNFKVFNDNLFFKYLLSYKYPKQMKIIEETLSKLEYHGCIKILKYEDYSYTIQLTNFVDQDTINNINAYQMEKVKIKPTNKPIESNKEEVKEVPKEAIKEVKKRDYNILETEAEEQRIKIAQRKLKDLEFKRKYSLHPSYHPPQFDSDNDNVEESEY